MDSADVDFALLEDPAPSLLGTNPLPPSSKPLKRRLPYRADVVPDGRRYKGRRVSREAVGLDVETLGILDQSDQESDHEGSNELAEEEDVSPSKMNDDSDGADYPQRTTDGESEEDLLPSNEGPTLDRRRKQLLDEERAIANRLAKEKTKNEVLAAAVRHQKVSQLIFAFPFSPAWVSTSLLVMSLLC